MRSDFSIFENDLIEYFLLYLLINFKISFSEIFFFCFNIEKTTEVSLLEHGKKAIGPNLVKI